MCFTVQLSMFCAVVFRDNIKYVSTAIPPRQVFIYLFRFVFFIFFDFLRCVQIGLSISELDLLTIGTVNDMYAEMSNDDWDYPEIATQEMMDRF